MAVRTINGADELKSLVGQHIGYSDWVLIDQQRVNLFADATDDHQWIHVDPERAAKESPFGGAIAHGYLTLSLAPTLLGRAVVVKGFNLGVNYGCNKVRFPSPVPVGSRMRLGATIADVEDIPGGVQVTYVMTIECEGSSKPSCVAEVIYRMYA